MTTAKFDQRVLIEQLRYIEAQDTLPGDHDELPVNGDFSERLWLRAANLIKHNELDPMLHRAEKVAGVAKGIGLLVAAVLGALAANLALSGDSTINIYWLLLVLLGFNLVSMALWLVGISFKFDGLMAGALASFNRWLPTIIKQKGQASTAADRAWLSCHFAGRVGKWQLGTTTHLLWLVYLLAGLAVISVVLMARQYQFVWGTTLLSDSAFVSLTEWLGKPLQVLGLTIPTAEQVVQSRVGVEPLSSLMFANSWAQFLLGAMVVYGLLPRLLLWLWANWRLAAAKRQFSLDYYLPYYISLRQQLLPQAGQTAIDDLDGYPPEALHSTAGNGTTHTDAGRNGTSKPPAGAHWVAVEIDAATQWPPQSVLPENDLGQVHDRESLEAILETLKNSDARATVVAVTATRAPDRGVQRTISNVLSSELLGYEAQVWLVLLNRSELGSLTEARLAAWYRVAEACKVPADQVVLMDAMQKNA